MFIRMITFNRTKINWTITSIITSTAIIFFWCSGHTGTLQRRVGLVDLKSPQIAQPSSSEIFAEDDVKAKKILILGYMRGGTTLIHEVFDHDKRATAWYEPMAPLYGQLYGLPANRMFTNIIYSQHKEERFLSQWEVDHVVEFFRSMYACDLDSLGPDVLSCTFMKWTSRFQKYLSMFRNKSRIPQSSTIQWEATCIDRSRLSRFCGDPDGSHGVTVTSSMAAHCDKLLEVTRRIPASRCGELTTSRLKSKIYEETGLTVESDFAQALKDHRQCMATVEENVLQCRKAVNLDDVCRQSSIRTSKVLRLRMAYVRELLQAIPDLHVIHYVRNPLAISFSFTGADNYRGWINSSKDKCKLLQSNVVSAEELSKNYPNQIHTLHYEDLVLQPKDTLRRLYSTFDESVPPHLTAWLLSTMHAKNGDNGRYNVARANGTASLDKWKAIPEEAREEVINSDECKGVLLQLGYEL